jgi:hypothetical protein
MLKEEIKLTLKDAAKKLTGSKKRAFMAQVTIDYWNSCCSSKTPDSHATIWKGVLANNR